MVNSITDAEWQQFFSIMARAVIQPDVPREQLKQTILDAADRSAGGDTALVGFLMMFDARLPEGEK